MKIKRVAQKVAPQLAGLSIAVLPLLFIRPFEIFGLQINIFHLFSAAFILCALFGYRDLVSRRLSAIEIWCLFFIFSISTYTIFFTPDGNSLKYFIKISYYFIYFRSLQISFSNLDPKIFLFVIRTNMMLGLFVFSFIFILAYNLPLEPPYECTLLQAEPKTDIKLTSPRKQGSLFYELTVPTLRNFSKILPSKTICRSRDIGVNALAGVFVLYITIIIMTISRTKLLDTAMIFLCCGYTLIMSSRGSLIILFGIIIWVLLMAVKQHYFKDRPLLSSRQIICIIVGFLVVLLVTHASVWSYITSQSRYILFMLSIEEILKEPLLGHGLGSKLTEGVKHSIYPHGFMLASWFIMGILGLLSSLAIFLTLIVYFVRSSFILICGDRINYKFTLASILLFSPILTLLIRGSVESIFLISDWVNLAIYLSLANQSTTNRHTS